MLSSLLLLAALQASPAADTLTLVKAVELGRARAISATLARLNAQVAENRAGQRRSELLPHLSGGASYARQTRNLDEFGIPIATGVTDPFSVFSLQLRASQTIFDAAAFARLKAARDSVIAAGHDTETAGVLAGAAAGIAYLRALSAEETVTAREADSTVAARLLDQARQLLDAGITAGIDVTRSEVNFSSVRAQLVVARNQRDRARLDLARALDFPADTGLVLARTFGSGAGAVPTGPSEAVRFALEHRSELKAERERLKVLERTRASIRAENLPSVDLSGSYTQSGRETDNLRGSYVAQLGVAIPIFDGFRRQLRSREVGIREEAQTIRIHDLERQVETETRQSLLDLSSAAEQVTLAEERARLAERELSQAEERFRAGVAGSIETTTAQAGLIAARDAVIQARVGLGVARVNAHRALGILSELR